MLSDCKFGSDKPDDNTLRLTLIYTPGLGEGGGNAWEYHDQTTQDLGHHAFLYGLTAHNGNHRRAQTDWQAERLTQPLIAFTTPAHKGTLGKSFSLLDVSNTRVKALALKKAEHSDEIILRLVELDGAPAQNVRISFAAPILAAREVTGQEQPLPDATTITKGELVTNFTPFQLRTFAVRLGAPRTKPDAPHSRAIKLPYNLSVSSLHDTKSTVSFDSAGRSFPAEIMPEEISYGGIRFNFPHAATNKPNALVPRGQTLNLPSGNFMRAYILAASTDEDRRATFRIGDTSTELLIQKWSGFIRQWDNRQWKTARRQLPPNLAPDVAARMREPQNLMDDYAEMTGITPGFIKRAPVAWFASHHHTADGRSNPYAYSYLFAYPIDIPANAKTLTLPTDDKVRIMAITVSDERGQVRPAQPLYDTLERAAR